MQEIRHSQLKEASRLLNIPISVFAAQVQSPHKDEPGVTGGYVIRVAQGYEKSDWLEAEIDSFIAKAKREFPEYYRKKELRSTG
jgi:hypothetical protein